MKHRIIKITAHVSAILSVLIAGILVNADVSAQQRRLDDRRVNRPLVGKDAIRHQQAKRAYVAGAVAQHRRERIRDHYEDRIRRERYYSHHHHHDGDDALTNFVVGAAIGAIVTGAIMHNNEERDSR